MLSPSSKESRKRVGILFRYPFAGKNRTWESLGKRASYSQRINKNMEDINKVVCQSCLHENDSKAAFCEKCNAPIGQYVTTDPVQSAISEGRALSDGIRRPMSPIVVVGIWILFAPFVIAYFVMAGITIIEGDIFNPFAIGIGLLGVAFGFLVVKTTRNYLKLKKEDDSQPVNKKD